MRALSYHFVLLLLQFAMNFRQGLPWALNICRTKRIQRRMRQRNRTIWYISWTTDIYFLFLMMSYHFVDDNMVFGIPFCLHWAISWLCPMYLHWLSLIATQPVLSILFINLDRKHSLKETRILNWSHFKVAAARSVNYVDQIGEHNGILSLNYLHLLGDSISLDHCLWTLTMVD